MNYTVGNFIIGIKNAGMAKRRDVFFPYSNVVKEIGDLLAKNKLIEFIKTEKRNNRQVLHIKLVFRKADPVIRNIKIISKPSLRVYEGSSKLFQRQKAGAAFVFVTTSKGLKTAWEARKEGLGGEVLFEIS